VIGEFGDKRLKRRAIVVAQGVAAMRQLAAAPRRPGGRSALWPVRRECLSDNLTIQVKLTI